MNTILMNSKNSKTSDPHKLLHSFTEKLKKKFQHILYMDKYKKAI